MAKVMLVSSLFCVLFRLGAEWIDILYRVLGTSVSSLGGNCKTWFQPIQIFSRWMLMLRAYLVNFVYLQWVWLRMNQHLAPIAGTLVSLLGETTLLCMMFDTFSRRTRWKCFSPYSQTKSEHSVWKVPGRWSPILVIKETAAPIPCRIHGRE